MLTPSSSKTIRPKGGIDKLFTKAFAPPSTPTITPSTSFCPLAVRRPMAPEPPATPLSAASPEALHSLETTTQTVPLDPFWDELRQAKERTLAASPSKVRSLDAASPEATKSARPVPLRRKSSIVFKESADGRTVSVTFDMSGVRKQDMHVSFRTSRVMVSWRVIKSIQREEGDLLIKEREEKTFSHVLPIPAGTKFDEIKANRDGKYLTLTFPNYRCIRVGPHSPTTKTALSGDSDFKTCAESR